MSPERVRMEVRTNFLGRQAAERSHERCPRVLGIDEHFFTKRKGYATTFCDWSKRRVFDVALGRSEASLERYIRRMEGKERVQVVCIDLSSTVSVTPSPSCW